MHASEDQSDQLVVTRTKCDKVRRATVNSFKLSAAVTVSSGLGVVSALPISALIVVFLDRPAHPNVLTQSLKVLLPILPFVGAGTWVQWNSKGRSILDGGKNKAITSSVEGEQRPLMADDYHVCLALFANLPNVATGYLFIHVVAATDDPWIFMTLGSIPGALLYTLNLLTEIVLCFRKHAEYCDQLGLPIYSFLEQPIVRYFLTFLIKAAKVTLEIFPPLTGLIRAIATVRMLNLYVNNVSPFLSLLSAIVAHQSTAFVGSYFDLKQCKDSLAGIGIKFSLQNSFSSADFQLSRALGRLQSGEALYFLLRKTKISAKVSADIILACSVIPLCAILMLVLLEFFISFDESAVRAGNHAKLVSTLFGTEQAAEVGKGSQWPILGAAALVSSAVSFFVKRDTLQNHFPETELDELAEASVVVVPESRQRDDHYSEVTAVIDSTQVGAIEIADDQVQEFKDNVGDPSSSNVFRI